MAECCVSRSRRHGDELLRQRCRRLISRHASDPQPDDPELLRNWLEFAARMDGEQRLPPDERRAWRELQAELEALA